MNSTKIEGGFLRNISFKKIMSEQKLIENQLLNILGLQIIRIAAARWKSVKRIRSIQSRSHESSQQTDLLAYGFTVIPNFLSPKDFHSVRNEFHSSMKSSGIPKKIIQDTKNYVRETIYVDSKSGTPRAYQHIFSNKILRKLLLTSEGLPSKKLEQGEFQVAFWHNYYDSTQNINAIQTKHTNSELHSDTFHTISKAFYYIEPVTKANGAHIYVPSSHRLTLRRLWFEYWNSFMMKEESPRVSKQELLKMGLSPHNMEFPANTLLVENTFGFHAAGSINPGKCRDVIYIQFRWPPFLDPPVSPQSSCPFA